MKADVHNYSIKQYTAGRFIIIKIRTYSFELQFLFIIEVLQIRGGSRIYKRGGGGGGG